MFRTENNLSDIPLAVNYVAVITGENVVGCGEDSHAYAFGKNYGFTGVFDGGSISGSSVYPCFSNKTGAYIASNIAACAASDSFGALPENMPKLDILTAAYKSTVNDYMSQFKELCDEMGLDAPEPPAKLFPTTAAVTYFDYSDRNNLVCHVLWTGNCRSYVLDRKGLAVLTADDISDGSDGASFDDTRLTNIICADGDYTVNRRVFAGEIPSIVINATPGCYSAFSNPSELEFLILYTLDRSKSLKKWEEAVGKFFRETATDDYTLCISAFGFNSFDAMKSFYKKRLDLLTSEFIEPLKDKETSPEDKEKLLKNYFEGYNKYADTVI